MYKKLLEEFRKASQKRKETIYTKYGYSSAKEYTDYLESMIKSQGNSVDNSKEKEVQEPKEKQTIRKVNIIDCSGSMFGEKIIVINEMLKEELKELEKNTDVNILYSLLPFSYNSVVDYSVFDKEIQDVKLTKLYAEGYTALYDAIGKVYEDFKDSKCKVLVNIYTDGDENNSIRFSKKDIKSILKQNNNFTFTFVGTKEDVNNMINDLGLDSSNTLVHNNTAESIKNSIVATIEATNEYTQKVSKGIEVKTGFYKKLN